MDEWRGRVDELLYAGESIEERIGVGDAEVVVTTHRVLALTPSGDGERYRAIDRPNVLSASIDAGGDRAHLLTAGKAGLVAALLFALAAAVDLGGAALDVAGRRACGCRRCSGDRRERARAGRSLPDARVGAAGGRRAGVSGTVRCRTSPRAQDRGRGR